jgi:hypothetical protein
MNFQASHDLRATLELARVESVKIELHLRSGKSFVGSVGGLGDHHVVLTQLTGREFYDALVRIEDISAIEARVRNR